MYILHSSIMITATMANNKNNLLTFFTPFCESLRNEKMEKRASYYNIILLTNKMKKNIIKVLRIKTKKKKVKIAFVPASAIFCFLDI